MDCFSLDNRVQKGTNDSRSIKKPSSSTRGRLFNLVLMEKLLCCRAGDCTTRRSPSAGRCGAGRAGGTTTGRFLRCLGRRRRTLTGRSCLTTGRVGGSVCSTAVSSTSTGKGIRFIVSRQSTWTITGCQHSAFRAVSFCNNI